MSNTKYLYGAAVQGIQSFIFKTNKLKEIVGASELVERICTDQFYDLLKKARSLEDYNPKEDDNIITTAAGNVKYLFESEEACQEVVLNFPKQIMEYAPGITISQAVVKVNGELSIDDLNELEKRLKAQRNKPVVDLEKGLLITERSRRTGMPAVKKDNQDFLDKATCVKLFNNAKKEISNNLAQKIFGHDYSDNELFQNNSNELSIGEEHSYIAVIHADGNNLGKIIQQLGTTIKTENDSDIIKKAYSNFSKAIDEATEEAAQYAYKKVFDQNTNALTFQKGKYYIPFRPIVLSGDDLTVICEAKYAMDFTKHFLEKFEATSKKQIETKLLKDILNINIDNLSDTEIKIKANEKDFKLIKLTACAGIAFVKNKFPFYYAVNLAEELCSEAKKVSKAKDPVNAPSSLLFYKVESTFIDSYKQIQERVLTANNIKLQYGPYFVDNGFNPSIKTLLDQTAILQEKDAPASQLRRWLSALNRSKHDADLLMQRTCEILELRKEKDTRNYVVELGLTKSAIKDNRTHIHDVVALASLTKQKEEASNE